VRFYNQTMSLRRPTLTDSLVTPLARALNTPAAVAPTRDYPGQDAANGPLPPPARRHAAGLMRVNHAGEIAAQGLYHGQALTARRAETRTHLLHAAAEERAHMDWCARRLQSLDSAPSRLAPLWFGGSYAMGAVAGLFGDGVSLGFVRETERQVEEHLDAHLRLLPGADAESRAVLKAMQADEARHGAEAEAAGGVALPQPVRGLMAITAQVMKRLAYYV